MSLLVRKDMRLSTDPFSAHHLVVKTPAHLDTGGVTSRRSKPDEQAVSDVTSSTELAEKETNMERLGSVNVETQPTEVCMIYKLYITLILPSSCVQLHRLCNNHYTDDLFS